MRRTRIVVLALVLLAVIVPVAVSTATRGTTPLPPRAEFVPGEVLIKFLPSARPIDVASAKSLVGARDLTRFRSGAEHWKLGIGVDVEDAIERLSGNPLVQYVEPNYIVSATVVPNDPRLGELWGMINTGQTGGTNDADIDAELAWGVSTGSDDVIVGVIDTGIDYNHPDLAANIWTNLGEIPGNGIDDDANGFVDDIHGYDFVNNDGDPFDDHYHGTHVSGTIGAIGDNGIGVAGVNWHVKLMGLKFLSASGSGTTANAVRAVDYSVMMGVDLTSNSWGGGGFSQALYDSIANANANNMAFVAAAGNNGTNNDTSPHYPSNYDLPNVISVAATDHNDAKASFSNYGPVTVDLGAPGDDVLSTTPGNSYQVLSGTSMATPHVAGVCALIRAVSPNISVAQLKNVLLNSVDVIPSMQGRVVSNGRLNAFFAIAEPDDVPPGMIDDLAVVEPTSNTMILSWTATGDDGDTGTANEYEVRYSVSTIDEGSWSSATRAGNEPAPGPAGTPEQIEVRGLDSDTYYHFAVKAFDEWGNPGPLSNIASAATLSSPTGEVAPTSIADDLFTGEQADHVVTLTNIGVGTLDFTIPTPSVGEPMAAPQEPLELGKDDIDPRQGDPVIAGSGGPDAFGYRWVDSDEPGGPAFNWIDISATGTPLNLTGDDSTSAPLALGFNVPFYGTFFDSIRACSNGWISFTNSSTAYGNQPLPSSGAPENLIAPFWDDLNPKGVNRTFFQSFGDRAIVQWQAIEPYSGTGSYTFQAIVDVSGAVTFQYLTMVGSVESATIGMQDAGKTRGLTVAFNQAYLHDGLAVRIASIPQWLTAAPTAGRLRAGESATINVHLDASGLEGGTYPGVVSILTNDPAHPSLDVNVALHVIGAPDGEVQPSTITFGDEFLGLPATRDLIVANEGTDTLYVSDIVASDATLSVSPATFSVPPHGSQVVTVTWTPAVLGAYSGSLTVLSNDAGEPSIPVAVIGNAIPAPVLIYDPLLFSENLYSGQQVVRPLTVRNTGGSDLVIQASTDQGNGGNGEVVTEEGALGSGGPDLFGYRWKDSDASGGPMFEWVDISSTGTQISFSSSDDAISAAIPMGMTFPFYGSNFSSLKVSTNGWLTFDTTDTSSRNGNVALPSASGAKNMVAVFWDDLHLRTGNVKYKNDGSRFIVQYTNVGRYSPSTGQSYTFQVQLYPSGRILVQFLTMTATNLNSATIGIQDGLRTTGLTANYNSNYVHDSLAVQFSRKPDWLTVTPASATIPPGGQQVFDVRFDATDREGGTLNGSVRLRTNIPSQSLVEIPASLRVIGVPIAAIVPASYNYGPRFIGYAYPTDLLVVNNGTDVLNITDVTTDDPTLVVQEPIGGEWSPGAEFPLLPGQARLFTLRWQPVAPGALTANVHVLSDDPVNPDKTMPVTGFAQFPPIAAWSPGAFSENLMAGEVVTRTLRIDNGGGSDLTYVTQVGLNSGATVVVDSSPELKKDEEDTREGVLGSGGPDLYGYTWRDSDQAGGPTFAWEDISAVGTPVTFGSNDDSNTGPINLGFPFPFYGQSFSSIRVTTNGWLSFTNTTTALTNYVLPSTSAPENLLAVFHDDLYQRTTQGSNCKYYTDGNKFIVQWTNWDQFTPSGENYTFQAILYRNGRIKFQYLSMTTNDLAGATIGIQNATKNDGLTTVFNAPYVHNNLAVEFRPPAGWLILNPEAGTIPPGGSADVQVTFDASQLIGGVYGANIDLSTNDPANALIRVPATLTVVGIPDIAATPDSATYPMTYVGYTRSQNVKIQNVGTDVLTIADVQASGDFSFAGITTPASLAVGDFVNLAVTFAPTAAGSRSGALTVVSDDPDESSLVVALQGEALVPPELDVRPGSLSAILPPAATTTMPVQVCNTGGSDLTWGSGTNIISVVDQEGVEKGKEEPDTDPGVLGTGGPDVFGYRWIDSDEPGGPTFDWIDITGIGTRITALDADDEVIQGIPLGMDFSFYGNTFNTLAISTNGWLSFSYTGTTSYLSNYALPSTSGVPDMLALFWDDLDFRPASGPGAAYYWSDGNTFVLSYITAPRYSTHELYTFQVILNRSGRVKFQYLTMEPGRLDEATIGIQNQAKNDGLTVTYNLDYVHDGLAVEFRAIPQWATMSPTSGVVPAGACQEVMVTLDSTDLEHGTHDALLRFRAENDPYLEVQDVPVTLVVNNKPVADAGPAQSLECTGNLSAMAMLDGSGSSDADGDPLTFSWTSPGITFDDPASVTPSASFPLGVSAVSLVVNDSYEDSDPDTVEVSVVDTIPPTIVCPVSATVECQSNLQSVVSLAAATATDTCDPGLTIVNDHNAGGADASGSYPLGTTVVTFTATDAAGNNSSCQVSITVVDTTAPTLTVTPTPASLWPPNHGMSNVHFEVVAVDACYPTTSTVLVSATSSEPDDAVGGGDGHTDMDVQGATIGTADFDLQLRSERQGGGDGRTYTATYQVTDGSGNSTIGSGYVLVPHDLGDIVEPIEIRTAGSRTLRLDWGAVNGAVNYDVVRGDLANVRIAGANIDLGPVVCVEQNSLDTTTAGFEDTAIPASGKVFFYAVQFHDGIQDSSYGSESAGRARVVGQGGSNCR